MAIWGVNEREVENFIIKTNELLEILRSNDKARADFESGGSYYEQVKHGYKDWLKFAMSTYDLSNETKFYRVRSHGDQFAQGFKKLSNLKYPPNGKVPYGRSSSPHALNVMYTSFHELTAIAECRLHEGEYFQLTQFKSDTPIKCFQFGAIANAYLNTPRDSSFYTNALHNLGLKNVSDNYIRGIAALELALMNVFYASQDEEDENFVYLLSSLIAECVFLNDEGIDAIVFPSIQNSQRYGTNVTFSTKKADELKLDDTSVNQITRIYQTGFVDYRTLYALESLEVEDELLYKKVDDFGTYRYR